VVHLTSDHLAALNVRAGNANRQATAPKRVAIEHIPATPHGATMEERR